MLVRFNKFIGQSLHRKILLYILLAALVPLIMLSLYTLNEIKHISNIAVTVGKERLQQEVITLQEANLNNQAQKAEQELRRVEDSVRFLRQAVESTFNRDSDYYQVDWDKDLKLIKDERGFYWTPNTVLTQEKSTVFLSNISELTPKIKKDIILSEQLEDFFGQIVWQNENIVAVYFVTEDSLSRIYPALDFSDLIDRGKLPADMRVQEYPFYYPADPINNPQRDIVWTESYFDVTDRGWMITVLAPIYLADGTFKGIIGADVTFEKLAQNIINPTFAQPGAYAFLIDNGGNLLGVPEYGSADFGGEGKLYGWNLTDVINSELKEILEQMVLGQRGSKVLNLSKEDKYFLYSPLPTNGWSLAFVIPVNEIVAPIKADISNVIKNQISEMSYKLIVAGMLITIGVTSFSFFISWRLIQPIKKLTEGSRALSDGESNHYIKVDSYDEIGTLAHSFNEMARRLKDLINALKEETYKQVGLNEKLQQFNKKLEEKVSQRTVALQKKNEELRVINDKLQQTEEARRTIIANVSHDLRTPFTSVQGFIEALQDGIAKTEEQKERYFNIICNRIQEINKLLDDLFLLSQLQARQEIHLRPVDGGEFIKNLMECIDLELEGTGIKFEKKISFDLPVVYIDAERLRRVFNNIIQNALEHTQSGGLITVAVDVTENGDMQVIISDTGTGIPQEDLPHIFERFYKIGKKEHRTGKGAGLGLAIAKEIIEAHGGRIAVTSQVGVGTAFSIWLKSNHY
ncbi:MAG: HAMP domain-containing protein [Clostridia bacterium]|nr:HAMP domain-containing protein [Clostridia bacterium]